MEKWKISFLTLLLFISLNTLALYSFWDYSNEYIWDSIYDTNIIFWGSFGISSFLGLGVFVVNLSHVEDHPMRYPRNHYAYIVNVDATGYNADEDINIYSDEVSIPEWIFEPIEEKTYYNIDTLILMLNVVKIDADFFEFVEKDLKFKRSMLQARDYIMQKIDDNEYLKNLVNALFVRWENEEKAKMGILL